ncbi:MAG: ribosomal protein S18-alanine N-acetyltransferase [Clostridiales bacterium]
MGKIDIFKVKLSNINEILEIEKLSFSTPWTKKIFENELINEKSYYICATINNIVVGYIGVWIILDECHIMNLAVHPEYRGLGIASLLIENIIFYCHKLKVLNITLEVRKSNVIAQNLYKKFDFKSEGIRKSYYEDNKEDALIMWKKDKDT